MTVQRENAESIMGKYSYLQVAHYFDMKTNHDKNFNL